MRLFTITIGRRGSPRLTYPVMAPDAQIAGRQADGLALPGERVDVYPEPSEEELLAADTARDVNKGERLAARNDAMAAEAQAVYFRALGVR